MNSTEMKRQAGGGVVILVPQQAEFAGDVSSVNFSVDHLESKTVPDMRRATAQWTDKLQRSQDTGVVFFLGVWTGIHREKILQFLVLSRLICFFRGHLGGDYTLLLTGSACRSLERTLA